MRVSDVLAPGAIVVRPAWRGFDESVRQLVERLVAADRIPARLAAAAVEAVRERERADNTAIVDIGASVPHARLPGLPRPAAAMAVSSAGLYEVTPGVPVFLTVLLLSPAEQVEEHLELLQACSILLHSEPLRARLLRASDPSEVHAALARWEQRGGYPGG